MAIASARNILEQRGLKVLGRASYYRGKALVYEKVLGRSHLVRPVHDYRLLLDVRDRGISRELMLYGTREVEHRMMLYRALTPGMTVLDIGANIGYYAVMALRCMRGQGRLIAVEPSPDNVRLLRRNLELNGCRDVSVLQSAVSDAVSRRALMISAQSNLHSFHGATRDDLNGSSTSIEVDTTTVPALAEQFGAIDLIRMDVEGHEVEILQGMVDAVEDGRLSPMVLFEAHPSYYSADHDIRPVLKRLMAAGYRARMLGSADMQGAERIKQLGYAGSPPIATDGQERVIFDNIKNEDALWLIGSSDCVRSVLLTA